MRHLEQRGIGTAVHYPIPIHLQEAAVELGYREGSFPVAEYQAQHILSLPVYPELDASDILFIANQVLYIRVVAE